jgi:hypothetical protein
MKILSLLLLAATFFSCKQKIVKKEQAIFDRIEFVFTLKQTVDEGIWKTFNDKKFEVPLIYFTDTSSYVANPTDKFLTTFHSSLVFESRELKIYKTDNRIDSMPFHMETGLTLGTPTNEYNYHSPFMKCSSFEEASKKIPQLTSTEQWTTMIMHEYFHGFQYKHLPYISNYENNIAAIQPDSLNAVYKHNSWFKNSIDKENDLLLQAISETDDRKTRSLIDSFFTARNDRRILTSKKINFNIEPYEKVYETMEGTARYVEYSLYETFSNRQEDYKLKVSDTSFKSFEKFRKYTIENDKWLYLTNKTTYFYAIGFNMARLLDKLKIEYKSRLFNEGTLSLEDILKDKMNKK